MKIISADDVSVIKNETKNTDEDSLVIFDCDNVLTTVKVGTFKAQNQNFLKNYLHEKSVSKDKFYDKIRLVLINENTYIVNQYMVDLVANLSKRNIRHMVATSYSVRPLKDVPDPMQWRIDNLHEMGYFFEKSWPDQKEDIVLNDFGTDHNPIFRDGILFCDIFSKSDCIRSFFEHIGWTPKKIIFIDDVLRNLSCVGELCDENKIEYTGIEYIESQRINSHIPFSYNLGKFQMDHLINESIWLKDEEVHKILSDS
ncbi:MAG: DUF2608 domain-containing protein [Alphaproteobacteria bacterium]|nr:DUF2608 domain-containing protein [Alphaproteobacteria bacterium]